MRPTEQPEDAVDGNQPYDAHQPDVDQYEGPCAKHLIPSGKSHQKRDSHTADQGRTYTGRINYIGIKTDRGLNYPVEVVFENNPDLHAGMYLKVAFEEAGCSEGIFIPRKAVTGSVLAANVHVAEDGKARQRKVILGEMYGDRIEILEGLEEGEEIIVAGLMNVSDGSAIKIVNE